MVALEERTCLQYELGSWEAERTLLFSGWVIGARRAVIALHLSIDGRHKQIGRIRGNRRSVHQPS